MSDGTIDIPREKIPWKPKIDYSKCDECGKCVEYCYMKVYSYGQKGKKKPIVKNPNSCIMFCKGCQDICPTGAISHPPEEEIQKIIKKLIES